jgi:hypothetical protein
MTFEREIMAIERPIPHEIKALIAVLERQGGTSIEWHNDEEHQSVAFRVHCIECPENEGEQILGHVREHFAPQVKATMHRQYDGFRFVNDVQVEFAIDWRELRMRFGDLPHPLTPSP